MFILVIASAKHFQQICSVMFVAGFKLLANDHCITPIQKSRFVLTTGSKNKKLPKWHVYPIRMGQLNEQFIKHPASFPIVFPWVFPMVFFRKTQEILTKPTQKLASELRSWLPSKRRHHLVASYPQK